MRTTAAPVAAVLGWPRLFKSPPTHSFPGNDPSRTRFRLVKEDAHRRADDLGRSSGLFQAAAAVASLPPHGPIERRGEPGGLRLVAFDRDAHWLVLPITEEERAIARDILHRTPVAAPSIPLRLHHGSKVRLRTQRLRLDHPTEPVANHKPSEGAFTGRSASVSPRRRRTVDRRKPEKVLYRGCIEKGLYA
jgi:hypothetical protein